MKIEKIRRINKSKIIIGGLIGLGVMSAISMLPSYSKYRTIQSFNLVKGKITYKQPDLNLVAMYITDGRTDTSIDKVPKVGYELDKNRSKCLNNGQEDTNAIIEYTTGKLLFDNITTKGTKCNVYFNLIEDNEMPKITSIKKNSKEKTSITIYVTANDNIGVIEYWYAIDSDNFILGKGEEYTFNNLEVGSTHTIKVYVKDTAGNSSAIETKIFSTEEERKASEDILADLGINKDFDITVSTGEFDKIANTNEGIFSIDDDDGTSYFWRGAVINNYIKFAGFCWRIVRINGNGSIRIIYDGTICHANGTSTTNSLINSSLEYNKKYTDNTYIGYMFGIPGASTYAEAHTNTNDSTIKEELDKWYETNIEKKNYGNYIDKDSGFCNDRSLSSGNGYGTNTTIYAANSRLDASVAKPTLKCTQNNDLFTLKESGKGNEALEKPIGLITADEVVFAGGYVNKKNQQYYLYNGKEYWTMTPYHGAVIRIFREFSGTFNYGDADYTHGVRPVINLKSTTTFSTTSPDNKGTQNNPYIVQ